MSTTELAHHPEAGCPVITGHPGESFAVGADISPTVEFGSADGFSFAERGQSLFDEMETLLSMPCGWGSLIRAARPVSSGSG